MLGLIWCFLNLGFLFKQTFQKKKNLSLTFLINQFGLVKFSTYLSLNYPQNKYVTIGD